MAAGSTYTPIATTTLVSAAASYTFSSIPSTDTDLVIVAQTSGDSGGPNFRAEFNGDSGTNYSNTRLYGDGSAVASDRTTNSTSMAIGILGTSATDFGVYTFQIQNYANTTTYKTLLGRAGYSTSGYITASVCLWRSTAAITSVLLKPSTGNFRAGSTFTLYGIASA